MTPVLAVDDLRVRFWTRRGIVHAVNDISFSVGRGETLGIVGESGCGKSVTALAVMGILPRAARVPSGSVRLEGRELIGLPDREMRSVRGKEIAMIFQDPMTSLNPVLTVGRQLREPIETHLDLDRGGRRSARSSCSTRWASPAPSAACVTIRTSSRAGCASG